MKFTILAASLALAAVACTATQAHNAFTALEAGEAAACIIAKAALPDIPAVLVACKLGPEFTALAEQVLPATKAAIALDRSEQAQ